MSTGVRSALSRAALAAGLAGRRRGVCFGVAHASTSTSSFCTSASIREASGAGAGDLRWWSITPMGGSCSANGGCGPCTPLILSAPRLPLPLVAAAPAHAASDAPRARAPTRVPRDRPGAAPPSAIRPTRSAALSPRLRSESLSPRRTDLNLDFKFARSAQRRRAAGRAPTAEASPAQPAARELAAMAALGEFAPRTRMPAGGLSRGSCAAMSRSRGMNSNLLGEGHGVCMDAKLRICEVCDSSDSDSNSKSQSEPESELDSDAASAQCVGRCIARA